MRIRAQKKKARACRRGWVDGLSQRRAARPACLPASGGSFVRLRPLQTFGARARARVKLGFDAREPGPRAAEEMGFARALLAAG